MGDVADRREVRARGGRAEHVDAARVARREERHDDAHVLVPAGLLGVVDGIQPNLVAAADAQPVVGVRHGHRHVPRDGAGLVPVLRLGGEHALDLRAAHERDLVLESAGVEVATHRDDRPVVLLRNRVVPADAVALLGLAERIERRAGFLREDADLALVLLRVPAVAALDVEDGVEGKRA